MKHFLKVAMAVVLAGCAVCGCGRRDYGAKLNPTYKNEAANPYVATLTDRDGVRRSSRSIGIDRVKVREDIPFDKVVAVGDCRNYVVQSDHSQHYLVPQAKALLDEIGDEFRKRCKEERIRAKFIVTNLLRTEEDNRSLATVNSNVSPNSLHMNGTTFDITYRHYRCSSVEKAKTCDRIMGEILTDFRKEGKCWVLVEMNKPCYHITVRP